MFGIYKIVSFFDDGTPEDSEPVDVFETLYEAQVELARLRKLNTGIYLIRHEEEEEISPCESSR